MFPDFLARPPVLGAILLAALWRSALMIAHSHHWPAWYLLVAVVLLALLIAVIGLLMELVHEIKGRRIHVEKILVQQRYPYCHVTRLSTGHWFLTDKATGREYKPEHDHAFSASTGGKRAAGAMQSVWNTPDTGCQGRS